MTTFLSNCLSILVITMSTVFWVTNAQADALRLSDPVASDEYSETFGALLDQSLPELTLAQLLDNPASHLGQRVLINTRVGKVCQKKGCFFMALDGATAVRVSFRDYGFFVPTDSGDKVVTLEGELIEKELTRKQAAHFNKDIGETEGALKPGKVYEIVADAVRIPKSTGSAE